MQSEESFILRNYDWLMIVALLFGFGVTAYMQWIDRRRQKEEVRGVPNIKGIFVIYMLVTLMPVLLMIVMHILLSKFGKEPDSMFSYVPYFLISTILCVVIFQRPLKRTNVKASDRFWVYLFLILGFLTPLAFFINIYRPLTQPMVEVESTDKIQTVPSNHDYFTVQTFLAVPEKIYDRVTTSERKKIKMYYLGFVPITTSSQDTVFSIMFDESMEVKDPPTEIAIEEFRKTSRDHAVSYAYSHIKFFKKYHRDLYNSFLRKSGMVNEPFLIVTPSTYTLSRYVQDDVYLFIGIYLFCTAGFMVFAKFGSTTDSE